MDQLDCLRQAGGVVQGGVIRPDVDEAAVTCMLHANDASVRGRERCGCSLSIEGTFSMSRQLSNVAPLGLTRMGSGGPGWERPSLSETPIAGCEGGQGFAVADRCPDKAISPLPAVGVG